MGEERPSDDWQPWVCINKAFSEWLITLDDRQAISESAMKLACDEKYVIIAIENLKDLEVRKEKRTEETIAARKLPMAK